MSAAGALACSFGLVVALSSCINPSATTVFDQFGRQTTIVDTGIDPAGGVRLTTIGQFNRDGEYRVLSSAFGPGLAQTVLPSVLAAAGFVGGMQVLRPAEFNNQTSVNATNSGITAASNPAIKTSAAGGANTSGTATTTATGGSTTGSTVSASGGAGGTGGAGGAATNTATGTGGSSRANPVLTNTANPTATASPTTTNNPVVNSSNTSSPMFAPQFSPVTTTTSNATGGTGGTSSATTGASTATTGASNATGGTATGGSSSATTGASTATGGAANATGGTGSCQGNCQ